MRSSNSRPTKRIIRQWTGKSLTYRSLHKFESRSQDSGHRIRIENLVAFFCQNLNGTDMRIVFRGISIELNEYNHSSCQQKRENGKVHENNTKQGNNIPNNIAVRYTICSFSVVDQPLIITPNWKRWCQYQESIQGEGQKSYDRDEYDL